MISFPLTPTALRRNLEAALTHPTPRRRMFELVDAYLGSAEFSTTPETLEFAAPMLRMQRILPGFEMLSLTGLAAKIQAIFGLTAAQIVQTPAFRQTRDRAFDAILALRIRARAYPKLLPEYATLLRMSDLIEQVALADCALEGATPMQVLTRSIVLPSGLFPLPRPIMAGDRRLPPQRSPGAVMAAPEREARLAQLNQQLRTIDRAERWLSALSAADMEVVEGSLRPAGEALDRLPADLMAIFDDLEIDVAAISPQLALRRLATERRLALEEIERLRREATASLAARQASPGYAPTPGIAALAALSGSSVPAGAGEVGPPVNMALMRVMHQLVRYEGDEISHTESALPCESVARETRRLRRSEKTPRLPSTQVAEQERDKQTTERHELESEIDNSLATHERFEIGAPISHSYGPFKAAANSKYESEIAVYKAERTASLYARELVEETRMRVVKGIRERQIQPNNLEEFEEKFLHSLDNTGAGEPISGVYRWLDKIYAAEVREQGVRTVFEIHAPEPAAMYRFAESQRSALITGREAPMPFQAHPWEIRPDHTLGEYVRRYGVTGIEAPPEPYITVSLALDYELPVDQDEPTMRATQARDLDIPAGYEATMATVITTRNPAPEFAEDARPELGAADELLVTVGRRVFIAGHGEVQTQSLHEQTGPRSNNLPVTVAAAGLRSYTVAIEVVCRRTAAAVDAWSNRAHSTILAAYRAREDEHREALALLAEQRRDPSVGDLPDHNQQIIRRELQRAAISIMTAQHFDLFDAIEGLPNEMPRIDFGEARAEGEYVAFFSQAFEWDNMVYVFQPYFWGAKQRWMDRLLGSDQTDPLFAAFLEAGYVRIQVPVRPNFEEAVLWFQETGEIPRGEAAGVTTPEHLSILEELKANVFAEDCGRLVDSFEYQLPTTLHAPQRTGEFPVWQRDLQGRWIQIQPIGGSF